MKTTETKDSIVRSYLTQHPTLGPKEIAEKILKERKEVKKLRSGEVSSIKTKMKNQRAVAAVPPLPTPNVLAPSNGAPHKDELPAFVAVNRLVKDIGYERVKQILEAVK